MIGIADLKPMVRYARYWNYEMFFFDIIWWLCAKLKKKETGIKLHNTFHTTYEKFVKKIMGIMYWLIISRMGGTKFSI